MGAYAPNDYGLFDTAGNVWEWTQDVWRDADGETRPRRVLRGGSWVNKAAFLRASIRSRWFEEGTDEGRDFIGLRCAREANR